MRKIGVRIAGAPRVPPLPVMPWTPDSEAPRRLRNFVEEMLEEPDAARPAAPSRRKGFWARLTSEASGGGGYYSWKRLKDDAETPVDPPVTGTDNAKEVNGTEDLKVGAEDGLVVWMEKDTTDDPAEWRFECSRLPPVPDEDKSWVRGYVTGDGYQWIELKDFACPE